MTDEIWRIDVADQTLTAEPIPESWQRLGGRGLIPRILLDEVPPLCDPLGPFNKLLFTPGLLVGHMVSSCDRLSVGGKSPLTEGVKESNAGGTTALKLTHLGVKALIVEGEPVDDGWWVVHIGKNAWRFEPADDASWGLENGLVGLGVYESAERLLERYGMALCVVPASPDHRRRIQTAGSSRSPVMFGRISGRVSSGIV